MVSQFPQDYMHLVLLGVMRKLLYTWCIGPRHQHRLSATQIGVISKRLLSYRARIPVEFQRKPRSLLEIRNWKATELRQILCYTGPVAFRGVLHEHVYSNFMLLSCAMRILLSVNMHMANAAFAGQLLMAFARHVTVLYGQHMLTFNMHGVIHIATEAAAHGNLDSISSFPFENHLYQLKRLLRKPDSTLQQLVNRIHEQRAFPPAPKPRDEPPLFLRPMNNVHLPQSHRDCLAFEGVICQTVRYDNTRGNSCVEVNGRFGVIRHVLRRGPQPLAVVRYFSSRKNLFEYPAPSSFVGVHRVGRLLPIEHVVPVHAMNKCVLLPLDDRENVCTQMMSGL